MSSKAPTDITEDSIRELALSLGFVDVKVCAVSEVWSALKLLIRKELRASSSPESKSRGNSTFARQEGYSARAKSRVET
jgi:hypothetical protein